MHLDSLLVVDENDFNILYSKYFEVSYIVDRSNSSMCGPAFRYGEWKIAFILPMWEFISPPVDTNAPRSTTGPAYDGHIQNFSWQETVPGSSAMVSCPYTSLAADSTYSLRHLGELLPCRDKAGRNVQ